MSGPCPEPSESEHHPIEDAFTEEKMRLAGIYCRSVTGGPTEFDREVQEHLDRLERLRDEGSKKGLAASHPGGNTVLFI